jgi:hypothetical protein
LFWQGNIRAFIHSSLVTLACMRLTYDQPIRPKVKSPGISPIHIPTTMPSPYADQAVNFLKALIL